MHEFREMKRLRLKMDGYRCTRCGDDRIHFLTAHHVVPKSQGGTDTLDNLRTMCTRCHAESHKIAKRVRANRRAKAKQIRKAVKPQIKQMRDLLTRRVLELLAYFFRWLEEAIHLSDQKRAA